MEVFFIFIPKWGFVGAGFTTIIAYFVYFIGCYFVSQRYYKVNYNLYKVLIYMLVTFIIALFVPFAEIKYNFYVNIIYKILLIILVIILPLLIGLTDVSKLLYVKNTVIRNFKKIRKG